jgi:hypothetical protein
MTSTVQCRTLIAHLSVRSVRLCHVSGVVLNLEEGGFGDFRELKVSTLSGADPASASEIMSSSYHKQLINHFYWSGS